jgi:RNA polymerase sigma-70 factor, ECF subfamily
MGYGDPARVDRALTSNAMPLPDSTCPDVTAVFREHADFVWRVLQRLGIPQRDLDDVLQETFIVVHRRADSFDGTSKITTWLFGICMRVASRHRRRAYFQRERPLEEGPEAIDPSTPEDELRRRRAVRDLEWVLSKLSLERRAVLVFFELEGQSCTEIAELVGVPVGTVYSRLYAARRDFEKHAGRLRSRQGRQERGAP